MGICKKPTDISDTLRKKNPLQQSSNWNSCLSGYTGLKQASLPALITQGEVSYGAH